MTAETARILRYEVPVDNQWHLLAIPRGAVGQEAVLHVGCRNERAVEFWARESNYAEVRAYRVYGTGHPVPAAASYEGTAVAPGGRLVWHLVSASAESVAGDAQAAGAG